MKLPLNNDFSRNIVLEFVNNGNLTQNNYLSRNHVCVIK